MVLDMDNLFGESKQGIPVEKQVSLTRNNGVMSIIAPGTVTEYWSCGGNKFSGVSPDVNDLQYYADSNRVASNADGIALTTSVHLPNGAVVTGCVVEGNAGATAEDWYLFRAPIVDGVGEIMASAKIDTADTTITNATINNEDYSYSISTSTIDTGDIIYGARITYTISPQSTAGGVLISAQAYTGAAQNLKGFKGTYTINNQTGIQQTIDWNIANTTKGTTLESGTGLVLAHSTYSTLTFIWSTEEVSHGDVITFTITSGSVGTAGTSFTLGYASFIIESLEETNEAT